MNKEAYFENIKTYKLMANKSLGQNFLINAEIAEKIVNLLDLKVEDKNRFFCCYRHKKVSKKSSQ